MSTGLAVRWLPSDYTARGGNGCEAALCGEDADEVQDLLTAPDVLLDVGELGQELLAEAEGVAGGVVRPEEPLPREDGLGLSVGWYVERASAGVRARSRGSR